LTRSGTASATEFDESGHLAVAAFLNSRPTSSLFF
jgi:hypothetical protein